MALKGPAPCIHAPSSSIQPKNLQFLAQDCGTWASGCHGQPCLDGDPHCLMDNGWGWWGWDSSNCQEVGECDVRVTVGRDDQDAAPLRGTYGKGGSIAQCEG